MILAKPTLATFLAVADLSSVSAAGKRLGITQTAVTQRVKALEAELKVSLFTRSRSGMRLTPEGRSLLRFCGESASLEGKLLAEIRHGGEVKEIDLCVAGPVSLLAGRLAPQCRAFLRDWPQLNLRLLIEMNANRLNQLKRGTADLAFVFPHEVSAELDSKLVRPVEYLLVATANWRGRTLREIMEEERLFAYHQEDNTGIDYLRQFELLPLLKRSKLLVSENVTLMRMLELGVGYGILPRETAEPLLKTEKLVALNQGRVMKVPFALAWYPRAAMPRYFRQIIDSIH